MRQPFGFHPLIDAWFSRRFAGPTEPQRRGWPAIAAGEHTLIAAPTGSGKTLAAFLAVIDRLFRAAEAGTLADEIRVVYVSPLRALSNDMHRNLQTPLAEIAALGAEHSGNSRLALPFSEAASGLETAPRAASAPRADAVPPARSRLARQSAVPMLRVGLRTGDTPAAERARLLRKPPHILVTTPESLYLMLTSRKGRDALRQVDTLIIDEIHALVRDKRGSHLALTIERLAALSQRPIQRIGLSATQKPLEIIGEFLVGGGGRVHGARQPAPASCPDAHARVRPTIIDAGHQRRLDLAIEVPMPVIGAVCTHEDWAAVHARLVELIQSHRSTLIFVNTRRMAERLTHQLSELLGAEQVSSHHGSLSAELRLKTEQRLKSGELKAVVATASLELGIDVGYIDLVVQLGSPRSIAAFLQRIGRAGHSLHAIPKGRLFALTRDELLEAVALLRAIRRGRLDTVRIPEQPLDVLAQQIVAETAFQDWNADDLFALFRRAYPYRHLTREDFEETLQWMSEGLTERLGRRQALVYYDRVSGRIRARPAARGVAVSNAGSIPEVGSYRVVAVPEHTVIGSVDEDFAVESLRGDIFLLGNTSWRIEHVRQGDVVVSDAHGAPPTIPFWFGEAPGRTIELSTEVSELRAELERRVRTVPADDPLAAGDSADDSTTNNSTTKDSTVDWLITEWTCPPHAAEQIVAYIRAERAALGLVPTQQRVVFERFFDETGGMQLVIHAPFGSAINRAWGYALRKRFCRSFDFELQATADDDGILLSLGPQHSFPLESLFGMLNARNVRGLLEQAVLVQPPFQLRWRWNVTRALLVPRTKFGKKVPPALQRFRADDLLTAVFPQLTGCQENHTGDIELPDHPLVRQTMHDCLHEALDLPGLQAVLQRVEQGDIEFVPRDTREPSPFCHELLNAYPYAFLDGGEIQERRARAVSPGSDWFSDMPPLTWLDPAAIAQVVAEAAPLIRHADELHDWLLSVIVWPAETGMATGEVEQHSRGEEQGGDVPNPGSQPRRLPPPSGPWAEQMTALVEQRRAVIVAPRPGVAWWVAIERWPAVATLLESADGSDGTDRPARRHPSKQRSTPALLPDGFVVPPGVRTDWDSLSARVAVCRGWMEFCGPVTAAELAMRLGWTESQAAAALEALEGEGTVVRGQFRDRREGDQGRRAAASPKGSSQTAEACLVAGTDSGSSTTPTREPAPKNGAVEWCHRRLLARIHRLTLAGLRRQVEAVDVAAFQRFLWELHGLAGEHQRAGTNGLFEVLSQLQGIEAPAMCWERDLLPARLSGYQPQWLDDLCLTGEVGWGRLFPPGGNGERPRSSGVTRVVPMSIFLRADLPWLLPASEPTREGLGSQAAEIWELLAQRGALFAADLIQATRMLPTHLEEALGELIGRGLVTGDTFAGLRSLIAEKKDPLERPMRRAAASLARRRVLGTVTGRWSIFRDQVLGAQRAAPTEIGTEAACQTVDSQERLTAWAWQLVRRWGVVFRDLLAREDGAPRWSELVPVFRRLEARGELRGGRFIAGVAGEQFALEAAIRQLRKHRDPAASAELVVINAADPLNLVGIITPPPRIPAQAQNRIAWLRGVPVAVCQGDDVQLLARLSAVETERVQQALRGRPPAEFLPPPRRSGRKPSSPEYPQQIPRPLIR
jgi:ATP-dependent Lhr-like helicase